MTTEAYCRTTILQHSTLIYYSRVEYCTVLQYSTVIYRTRVEYCTVLYYTVVLYYIKVQYSLILNCTIAPEHSSSCTMGIREDELVGSAPGSFRRKFVQPPPWALVGLNLKENLQHR